MGNKYLAIGRVLFTISPVLAGVTGRFAGVITSPTYTIYNHTSFPPSKTVTKDIV